MSGKILRARDKMVNDKTEKKKTMISTFLETIIYMPKSVSLNSATVNLISSQGSRIIIMKGHMYHITDAGLSQPFNLSSPDTY